jgi:hypothetical protein
MEQFFKIREVSAQEYKIMYQGGSSNGCNWCFKPGRFVKVYRLQDYFSLKAR